MQASTWRKRAFAPTTAALPSRSLADADGAGAGHLGIDAALIVAEAAHKGCGDIEVARGGVGIYIDGGAAGDVLDHLQPRLSDRERPAEQNSCQAGQPLT
jgi:hypothetical protein